MWTWDQCWTLVPGGDDGSSSDGGEPPPRRGRPRGASPAPPGRGARGAASSGRRSLGHERQLYPRGHSSFGRLAQAMAEARTLQGFEKKRRDEAINKGMPAPTAADNYARLTAAQQGRGRGPAGNRDRLAMDNELFYMDPEELRRRSRET